MLFDAFRLTHRPRKHHHAPQQVAPSASSALRHTSFPASPPQSVVAASADTWGFLNLHGSWAPRLKASAAFASGRRRSHIPRAQSTAPAWLRPVHLFADAVVVAFVTVSKTAATKIRVQVHARTDDALTATERGCRVSWQVCFPPKEVATPLPQRAVTPCFFQPAAPSSPQCSHPKQPVLWRCPLSVALASLVTTTQLLSWGPVKCLHTFYLLFSYCHLTVEL